MSSDYLLLDLTADIHSYSQEKYNHVGRLVGAQDDVTFTLDVNSDLCEARQGDTIQLVIATTLSRDGSTSTKEAETARGGWRERPEETALADDFDYVCHGKVYRFDEKGDGRDMYITVNVSFGGLLLEIQGPAKRLAGFKTEYIYLLIKKTDR